MEFAIAALPGDGIGPEVIAESVKVLDAIGARFGHSFEVRSGPIGGQAIDEFGTALPDETLELCYGTDAVLFGAAGGPTIIPQTLPALIHTIDYRRPVKEALAPPHFHHPWRPHALPITTNVGEQVLA